MKIFSFPKFNNFMAVICSFNFFGLATLNANISLYFSEIFKLTLPPFPNFLLSLPLLCLLLHPKPRPLIYDEVINDHPPAPLLPLPLSCPSSPDPPNYRSSY